MSTTATTPNVWQYITYCYGRRLPDSMRDWVRNDLLGKGAMVRMVVRWTIPCILILLPLLLIPTTLIVYISMTVPIIIPFIYFSVALNKVYRRFRLSQHGLDPKLLDQVERERHADVHEAYEQRYGPREH